MDFDLNQLADRLRTAADRSSGLKVTVSGVDLILSKDGYGVNRSEAVPFASLFVSDRDVLGQALDRLKGTGNGE
jgi:hypothetical protein